MATFGFKNSTDKKTEVLLQEENKHSFLILTQVEGSGVSQKAIFFFEMCMHQALR